MLSIQIDRQIQNDFTVRHNNRFFQIGPKQPVRVYRKSKVCVQERLDGSIHIASKGRRLKFHEIPGRSLHRRAPRVAKPKDLVAKARRRANPFYAAFSLASSVPTNPPASALRQ